MKKILIILFLTLLPSLTVHADTLGLSVDQSVFVLTGNPGDSKQVTVSVNNISNAEQKMSIVPIDFTVGDNNAISAFASTNEQFGMKEWVKAQQPDWFLAPKESKDIVLTIDIPKDATIGSHYAIAQIQALPQIDAQNFQQMVVGGQVGVYILLNVGGNVSGNGTLNNFKAPIVVGKDVSLSADFENTGNILYIPHGEIHIQNLLTHSQKVLETEKHFVFPGKKYSFAMQWRPESSFGAYKAEAVFVDGDGKVHIAQRFVFGRWFFLVAIALILFVLWGVKLKRKRKIKDFA